MSRIEALRIAMYSDAMGLFVSKKDLRDGLVAEKYLTLICEDKVLHEVLKVALKNEGIFQLASQKLMKQRDTGEKVIHLIEELQTMSGAEINEATIPIKYLHSRHQRNYPLFLLQRLKKSELESLIDIGFLALVDQLRQLYKTVYMKASPLSFLLPNVFHMDTMWVPLTLGKGGKGEKGFFNGTEAYSKTITDALKRNKLTIITGEPFFGKTTLTQKIAYDWAMEKEFKDYDLVLIVPIRDVPQRKDKKPYAKIFNMVVAYIEAISGSNFDYMLRMDFSSKRRLVILDGYDEERTGCMCEELHNILQQRNKNAPDQPEFDILVTSRPSKTILRDKDVSLLSVAGFHTDDQRNEYITSHVKAMHKGDISGIIKKIMKTIKDMKLDHDLIESPMMLTLICLLHDELETVGKLYALNKLKNYDI
uniref:NACHT domain-containing protein n=1 Tax=Plectus sambesii TaxID=2011161 RepID=A0A914XH99_9BILA